MGSFNSSRVPIGIVQDRILINGDSFNLLENLPGSEVGCLMLKIKRHNQYLALRVIDRVSSYGLDW